MKEHELHIENLARFTIRNDLQKDKLIVALMINGLVTNDIFDITYALKKGIKCKLISKLHAEFMANLDLGINWQNLAKAPPIFGLDGDNIYLVDEGFMPKVDCIIETNQDKQEAG